MLAVKRKIVLEHEYRQFCRWVGRGLRKYRDSRLSEGDRSAAHAVAAVSRRETVRRAPVSRAKRVGRVARQDRDVVALVRVQSNLLGIYGGKSTCGGAGIEPANAIAHIADRWVVNPGNRIDNGLAPFARNRPCAALRHVLHVAGVEIDPKGWRDAPSRSRTRAARRKRYGVRRCAVGVDVESLVFLNDPAIVSDCGRFVVAVQNRYRKIARLREN